MKTKERLARRGSGPWQSWSQTKRHSRPHYSAWTRSCRRFTSLLRCMQHRQAKNATL